MLAITEPPLWNKLQIANTNKKHKHHIKTTDARFCLTNNKHAEVLNKQNSTRYKTRYKTD